MLVASTLERLAVVTYSLVASVLISTIEPQSVSESGIIHDGLWPAPVTTTILLAVDETSSSSSYYRLKQCPYESNCISSNYQEPPNRYVSPLRYVKDQDVAFQNAVREYQQPTDKKATTTELLEVLPKSHYLHISVPGTSPGSFDDVEIVFGTEGAVQLKCQARVTLPPPPFCIKKDCINGNMDQRRRLDDVSRRLGLPPIDQERMATSATWTPISSTRIECLAFLMSDEAKGEISDCQE